MSHHEVERAYAVGPDDALPDLGALPGVASVTEPVTAHLVATYLDTEDLALVRAGVTLRRRTGGADEGWHLKVPAGDGRDEVHRPLGSALAGPRRAGAHRPRLDPGRPLAPVAVVETERTTRLLLAADGTVLAEVADDAVVGTPVGGRPPWPGASSRSSWSPPAPTCSPPPTTCSPPPATSTPAASSARSAPCWPTGSRPPPPPGPTPTPTGPPDRCCTPGWSSRSRPCSGVTATCGAACPTASTSSAWPARRLRGALATYRPLVERSVTDPLRDELGWLARTLGDGRDAEVVRDHLHARLSALPRDQVVGPVRRRLDRTYAERLRVADRHAQRVLDSPRYLRLLGRLERLVAAPPWTDAAAEPAADLLRARVSRDWRRLRDRVEAAHALEGADDREEALHEVRKAAKRLRYACEVLEPGWGRDAKALRKAAQEVTRVLGERQDSAVARADLLRTARTATVAGESAFTYGVLHARERRPAGRARTRSTRCGGGCAARGAGRWRAGGSLVCAGCTTPSPTVTRTPASSWRPSQ